MFPVEIFWTEETLYAITSNTYKRLGQGKREELKDYEVRESREKWRT